MRKALYKFGWLLTWSGTALFSFATWLIDRDFASQTYTNWNVALVEVLKLLQNHNGAIFLLALVLFLAGGYRLFMRPPQQWQMLKTIIDQAQKIAYPDNHAPLHEHRITLFKYKKWCFRLPLKRDWEKKGVFSPFGKNIKPWGGWLVPIIRSGHTSQKTKTVFIASDNGEDAEGVCGAAWARGEAFVIDNLPEITTNSTDTAIDDYAQRSLGKSEMVKKRLSDGKTLPRSIGAIPIFVNNDIWGVLCLDSISTDGVADTIASDFTITVEVIQQILEKV